MLLTDQVRRSRSIAAEERADSSSSPPPPPPPSLPDPCFVSRLALLVAVRSGENDGVEERQEDDEDDELEGHVEAKDDDDMEDDEIEQEAEDQVDENSGERTTKRLQRAHHSDGSDRDPGPDSHQINMQNIGKERNFKN